MQVGDQIGHYTIVEHIGRGGMADVWSARDERLHRTVAVKTIMADLTDEHTRTQFEQEARTIAALEHSNILPIYDFGEFQRQLYIVMRFVAGGSLLDRIIDVGFMPDALVVDIGGAIARALERAHAENIVHRDLKPANVLLDRFGTPYLADFGLAAMAGTGDDDTGSSGTLIYMPPEQVMGRPVDRRADIYSFAVMLFQMITGEFPFDGQAALCLRQVQHGDDLPDPREYRPELPQHLTTVLRVATAADVNMRYTSAGVLMDEVTLTLTGRSVVSAEAARSGAMPPQEPAPYAAETDVGLGVDEDMIHTLQSPVDEELLTTMRIDATDAAPERPVPLQADSEEDLLERVLEQEVVRGEESGLREVRELFQRMVRAWARGQGRFLTGATHFATVHDYFSRPAEYGLVIDDSGREAMLRGAIEHNYELGYWLSQVTDVDRRRLIFVHALRSDLATARALAVELLCDIPDNDMTNIALIVSRLLHSETSVPVRRAIVNLLNYRGERVAEWREYAFNRDTDLLLAEQAVRDDAPDIAELAARTIGRLRSRAAVLHLVSLDALAVPSIQTTLMWVRDEADSLPEAVPLRFRARAFWRLTARYLSADIGRLGLRYFLALLGAGIGMGTYIHVMFPSSSILQLNHLYRVIANAQTFGLVAGLGLTLAAALPLRLAGSIAHRSDGATLWRPWARLFVGVNLGGIVGTIAFINFQMVSLQFSDFKLPVVAFGGLGISLFAAVAAAYRWPLWARLLTTGVSVFAPLALAWAWRENAVHDFVEVLHADERTAILAVAVVLGMAAAWLLRSPAWARLATMVVAVLGVVLVGVDWALEGIVEPIIFLRSDDQLWIFALMGVLMAIGTFGPEILAWLTALVRRGALEVEKVKPPVEPEPEAL